MLSRKLAGRKGAAEISAADLLEALVIEDQGGLLKALFWDRTHDTPVQAMPTYRPFFAAETAAEIQRGLEPLLPRGEPLSDSVDLPVSDPAQRLLMAAKALGEELRGERATPSQIQVGSVEPLHLLAAALTGETSATAEVLKHASITKEAVIAAIKTGEYS
jgi:Clp amino terminal domain, pathogenicity island component